MSKAIFLDRDGVLNQEMGEYVTTHSRFIVLNQIFPALIKWKQEGYKLIVITNQGGIAKGLMTHEDVNAIHQKLFDELKEAGIQIDDLYYCPHHPKFSLCFCRKPLPGMLLNALAKHHLNPEKCFMIGDTPRDIEAAQGAGIKGILVPSNSPEEVIQFSKTTGDMII